MCGSVRRLAASLPVGLEFVRRPDGVLMLRTELEFPDGDGFAIEMTEIGPCCVRFSDRSHTVMRVSCDYDGDALFRPKGLAACKRVLTDVQVKRDGTVFSVDTPVADVGAAGIRFVSMATGNCTFLATEDCTTSGGAPGAVTLV